MTTTIPAGWKLVPIEPTCEMLDAYVSTNSRFQSARSDWAAMLNAAPAAPGVSTVEDASAHKVVIDFDQVGSAGPFYVFDGRVTIPAVTVMDLVRMAAPAAGDALDAARWRFVRRKLCLTGNGDGTCAMQAINLPASIHGWPEPGSAVAEFCDAAIDAAIEAQRKGDA